MIWSDLGNIVYGIYCMVYSVWYTETGTARAQQRSTTSLGTFWLPPKASAKQQRPSPHMDAARVEQDCSILQRSERTALVSSLKHVQSSYAKTRKSKAGPNCLIRTDRNPSPLPPLPPRPARGNHAILQAATQRFLEILRVATRFHAPGLAWRDRTLDYGSFGNLKLRGCTAKEQPIVSQEL